MTVEELAGAIRGTYMYNLHSHTQYCDGRAPISEMVAAAADAGFEIWGVSPHSPLCVESPCNMTKTDVPPYLDEMAVHREAYASRMRVLTSMEIDYMSRDWGPHIDYFQRLPLDYRIGSVHFVPNQEGVPYDCDGSAGRFGSYLRDVYHGDLRYVVEKYFEQVLTMLELGGFEVLGHFDKIAGNASAIDPGIEENGWYRALIRDVISSAQSSGVIVEINTKAIHDRGRFYPSAAWWPEIKDAGLTIAVNSDAHYPAKVNLGRQEALNLLN